jgi:hypothetical protein
MVELMAAIEAREDQLIAALDQWNKRVGLLGNEAAKLPRRNGANSFYNESYDACARIASTRAHFERNARRHVRGLSRWPALSCS